jgi:hypothetical protein
MTGEQDHARMIAERVARRVSGGTDPAPSSRKIVEGGLSAELTAMRASLDNLSQKLVQLESRLGRKENESPSFSESADKPGRLTWATIGSAKPTPGNPNANSMYAPAPHPSQERFGVEEATVAELVDFFEGDKKCELEPGGKPCDHCAMCSSRGF